MNNNEENSFFQNQFILTGFVRTNSDIIDIDFNNLSSLNNLQSILTELNVNLDNLKDIPIVLNPEDHENLHVDFYQNLDKITQNNNDMCPICSETYNKDETIRLLKCNHLFHRICIDKWLSKESHTCPSCRTECGRTFTLKN